MVTTSRSLGPLEVLRPAARWLKNRWRARNVVPGWTDPNEQAYFQSYALNEYTGAGEIVDLGCLLGSTTIPLARGVRKNGRVTRKSKRIHAYDLFEWQPWMSGPRGAFKREYNAGESFLSEYEERIAPYRDMIEIYPGDLTNIGWKGGTIELLLVDANKSFDLCNYIYAKFFPKLEPHVSCVLEQDFKHYWTPWIHLLYFRLRDRVVLHRDVTNTCSTVFKVTKPVGQEALPLPDARLATRAELDEAIEHSLSLISGGAAWERANIVSSKVMFYIHLERPAEAREVLDEALRRGFTLESDLGHVQKLLAEIERTSASATLA